MSDSFFFQLVPEDEHVPLDTLKQAIEHISYIVRAVDMSVSRNWRNPRTWYVQHLSSSNPTIEIAPGPTPTIVDPSLFPDTAHVLVDGLGTLTEEVESPPEHFSEDEMRRLKQMRNLFARGKGLARIDSWAAPTEVTERPETPRIASVSRETSAHAERIIGSGYSEYGSIQGELGALRVRGQHVMTVWDEIHQRAVHCTFPRGDLPLVKDLLERRIRVSGLVRYYNDGRPAAVTELQEIRDLTPNPLRPRASFGSLPDLTGGRDVVEYLQIVRGERDA